MLHAFFLSFGVIFVAELGDKSQLMALAFATRYKTVPVLVAITLATGIVHLISVGIGGPCMEHMALAFLRELAGRAWNIWHSRFSGSPRPTRGT